METAKRERLQAEKSLLLFQNAISAKRPEDAVSLLSTRLAPFEKADYVEDIRRAVILERYEGYELDVARGLDDVGVRQWLRGRIRVDVPATDKKGERFSERFGMERDGDKWVITELRLGRTANVEFVVLPEDERKQIRKFAQEFAERIKEKQWGQIMYSFPKEGRIRTVKPSFFGRLMGRKPYTVSFAEDLMILSKFTFIEHPKVTAPLSLVYIEGKDLMLELWGRYRSPEEGKHEIKTIAFNIVFTKDDNKWQPFRLIIDAEDLP